MERNVREFKDGATSADASLRREFHYGYTPNWTPILDQLAGSLLVSAYHAGELVAMGMGPEAPELTFHHFERAMGIAVQGDRIAVGTQKAIWFLVNHADMARRISPAGRFDASFLARTARYTGEIQCHELAWSGDELWVVNTRFSCLCTFDDRHSFVPRWRPKFISALAAEDRCHLNGLALADGRPKFVTALGESDEAEGWRPSKATGGCLIDIDSDETILRGLAMPHSPRIHQGRLWLLDSGRGRLVVADLKSGTVETVAQLPGYPRGLALIGSWAFVGLSKLRVEKATFHGVPIADRPEALKSGVAVVDLTSGSQLALLEFRSGIDEIFDIQILPEIRSPLISGPNPQVDRRDLWIIP